MRSTTRSPRTIEGGSPSGRAGVAPSTSALAGGDPVPLASIAVNVRDQVDPKNLAKETPYVGLEHVPRRSMWLSNFETAAKVTSAKAMFRAGDVLFGKLRPYFHKVVECPV